MTKDALRYWQGYVSALSGALVKVNRDVFSPEVAQALKEAYFACNRASNALADEAEKTDVKPRRARRSRKK